MKKLLSISIGILLLASCTNTHTNEFIIKGEIAGKVPAKAFLQIYEDGEMKILDSANFVNGEFRFKGKVTAPDYYYIKIGDSDNRIGLFIENSKITINANIDSLRGAEIVGSKIQDEYAVFRDSNVKYYDQQEELYYEYEAATTDEAKKEVEGRYDSIENLRLDYVKEYVINNGNSFLSPYIINRELIYSSDIDDLTELTNAISPELKDYKHTKKAFERIELLRSLQEGKPAPTFTQNNTEENPVNLSDFKGKYLLIDFWASWCVPCRNANPTVVAMFNKYSAKGFTILGVSMDNDKEKWLEAIEADGLKWSQISTLEGWNNPVGKLYAVNSIPHAVLINPDGNIVKRGIHADELDELLGSLLN